MNNSFYDEYGMITITEDIGNNNIRVSTLDKRRGNSSRLLVNNVISEHGLVTVYVMNGGSSMIIESSYIGYIETQNLCVPKIRKLTGEYYLNHVSDGLMQSETPDNNSESVNWSGSLITWNDLSVAWTPES